MSRTVHKYYIWGHVQSSKDQCYNKRCTHYTCCTCCTGKNNANKSKKINKAPGKATTSVWPVGWRRWWRSFCGISEPLAFPGGLLVCLDLVSTMIPGNMQSKKGVHTKAEAGGRTSPTGLSLSHMKGRLQETGYA